VQLTAEQALEDAEMRGGAERQEAQAACKKEPVKINTSPIPDSTETAT